MRAKTGERESLLVSSPVFLSTHHHPPSQLHQHSLAQQLLALSLLSTLALPSLAPPSLAFTPLFLAIIYIMGYWKISRSPSEAAEWRRIHNQPQERPRQTMPRPDAYCLENDRLGKYIRLYPISLDELPAHPFLPGWPPPSDPATRPDTADAPATQPNTTAGPSTQPDAAVQHAPQPTTAVAPWLETLDVNSSPQGDQAAPADGGPSTERPPTPPPKDNDHARTNPDAITPAPFQPETEAAPAAQPEGTNGANSGDQGPPAGNGTRSRASSDPMNRRAPPLQPTLRPIPRQSRAANNANASRGPPLSPETERRFLQECERRYPRQPANTLSAEPERRLFQEIEQRFPGTLARSLAAASGPPAPTQGGAQRPQTSAAHLSQPTVPSEAHLARALVDQALTTDGFAPGDLPRPQTSAAHASRSVLPTATMIEEVLRQHREPGEAAPHRPEPQTEAARRSRAMHDLASNPGGPSNQTTQLSGQEPGTSNEPRAIANNANIGPPSHTGNDNSGAPESSRHAQRQTNGHSQQPSSTVHVSSTVSSIRHCNFNIFGEPVEPMKAPTPPRPNGNNASQSQNPPDSSGAQSGEPSGSSGSRTADVAAPRPGLAAFVRAVYYEAEAFMNHTYAKTFSVRERVFASRPSAAAVKVTARPIRNHQLVNVAWAERETWRRKPAGWLDEKGRWEAPWAEQWFARRSVHKDTPLPGTASLGEFHGGVREAHSQHEMEYTPDVYDAYEVMDWNEQLRGLDLGRDIQDVDMRSKSPLPSAPSLSHFGQCFVVRVTD